MSRSRLFLTVLGLTLILVLSSSAIFMGQAATASPAITPTAPGSGPRTFYNWDFFNRTGQAVNDLHITLEGPTQLSQFYLGSLNPFGSPSSQGLQADGTYQIDFSGATVQPDQMVHIGFASDSPAVNFQPGNDLPPYYWTKDGRPVLGVTLPAPGYNWDYQARIDSFFDVFFELTNDTSAPIGVQRVDWVIHPTQISLDDMTFDGTSNLPWQALAGGAEQIIPAAGPNGPGVLRFQVPSPSSGNDYVLYRLVAMDVQNPASNFIRAIGQIPCCPPWPTRTPTPTPTRPCQPGTPGCTPTATPTSPCDTTGQCTPTPTPTRPCDPVVPCTPTATPTHPCDPVGQCTPTPTPTIPCDATGQCTPTATPTHPCDPVGQCTPTLTATPSCPPGIKCTPTPTPTRPCQPGTPGCTPTWTPTPSCPQGTHCTPTPTPTHPCDPTPCTPTPTPTHPCTPAVPCTPTATPTHPCDPIGHCTPTATATPPCPQGTHCTPTATPTPPCPQGTHCTPTPTPTATRYVVPPNQYWYNWDLVNWTQGPVNDLHITICLLPGYSILDYYTGPLNPFGWPAASSGYDSSTGCYNIDYMGAVIQPNQMVHIGFGTLSPEAHLRRHYWTRNGQPLPDLTPPIVGYRWSAGPQVTLFNDTSLPIQVQDLQFATDGYIPLNRLNYADPLVAPLPWSAPQPAFTLAPGTNQAFAGPFPGVGFYRFFRARLTFNSGNPANEVRIVGECGPARAPRPHPRHFYNFDFPNHSGQAVNDLHLVLSGPRTIYQVYLGGLNPFGLPQVGSGLQADGTYALNFAGAAIQPGQVVHIGFGTDWPLFTIVDLYWTKDGVRVPGPSAAETHAAGTAGSSSIPVMDVSWGTNAQDQRILRFSNTVAAGDLLLDIQVANINADIDLDTLVYDQLNDLPWQSAGTNVPLAQGGTTTVPLPALSNPFQTTVYRVRSRFANGDAGNVALLAGEFAVPPIPMYLPLTLKGQ